MSQQVTRREGRWNTSPAAAPSPGLHRRLAGSVRFWQVTIILLVMVAWEILPRVTPIPSAFLVPLSDTIRTGFSEWGSIGNALWPTLYAIVVALAITWVVGVAVGFFLGTTSKLRFMLVLFGALYAVPFVVMYPLLTVWFGPGHLAKIIYACVYGLIPVVLTTASGVRSIDETLYKSALSMGASKFQLLTKVMLPAAMPTIIGGLRVGLGLVLIGVIVAEMLVSTTGGIGTLITAYRVQFNAGAVYFCILVVVALALAFEQILGGVQRKLLGEKKVRRQPVSAG